MPGLNGTGPQGQGPRTGGGFGNCRPMTGQSNGEDRIYGAGRGGVPRGGGRGRAFGGGRRHGRYAGRGRMFAAAPVPITTEDEIALLREESQAMQQQLRQIQSRIEELSSEEQ